MKLQYKDYLKDLIQLYNNYLIPKVEHPLISIRIKVKAKIFSFKKKLLNRNLINKINLIYFNSKMINLIQQIFYKNQILYLMNLKNYNTERIINKKINRKKFLEKIKI